MKAFAAFETDIYSREKKNIIITVFSRKNESKVQLFILLWDCN